MKDLHPEIPLRDKVSQEEEEVKKPDEGKAKDEAKNLHSELYY